MNDREGILMEYFDADVKPLYRLVDGFGTRLIGWQGGPHRRDTGLGSSRFQSHIGERDTQNQAGEVTLCQRSKNFYYGTVYHPLAEAQTPGELKEGFERWVAPIDHEEVDYLRQEARRLKETGYTVGAVGGKLLECGRELREWTGS